MLNKPSLMVSQMKLFKIQYNRRSANKYGWEPQWFDADCFNFQLLENIKIFQLKNELKDDGLVGPQTYRRIYTIRDALSEPGNRIFCNSLPVQVDGANVRVDQIQQGCYKKVNTTRRPITLVTHWDVCLSADSCKRVLEKRNISTHFVIDNDGTIVQLLDCNDIAWHAGNRRVNNTSIGIDFSNAFYLRYQRTYKSRGFGERPILSGSEVHGRTLDLHLGYYPAQLKAYSALVNALTKHYNISLECPLTEEGELLTTVDKTAAAGKFNGVVCHYHLTKRKIDTAGLELDEILKDLRQRRVSED